MTYITDIAAGRTYRRPNFVAAEALAMLANTDRAAAKALLAEGSVVTLKGFSFYRA